MLIYPHIDPIALQVGPLAIHWYGVTYLVAFGLFLLLGRLRLRHEPFASITGPGPGRVRTWRTFCFSAWWAWCLAGAWAIACFTNPATTSRTRSKFLRSGRAA